MATPHPVPPPGRPPWFPWVVGAGGAVAFAVVLFLIVANLGPGGRAAETVPGSATTVSAATTSTADAAPTTVSPATTSTADVATTTTVSPSTTTATTTTGALIEDRFDGATTGVPLFGPATNTYELFNGRGQLTGHTVGVLPVTYPVSVGDVRITFQLRVSSGASADARFGAIFFAEDPSDGGIDPWVAAWVRPSTSEIQIQVFDGGFDATISAPLPAAAGFEVDEWHTVEVTLDGGSVSVTLNGVDAIASGGPFPRSEGFVGFVMYAGADGDRMRVDDFVVEALG